jgi:hypothetical protein
MYETWMRIKKQFPPPLPFRFPCRRLKNLTKKLLAFAAGGH